MVDRSGVSMSRIYVTGQKKLPAKETIDHGRTRR